MLRIQESTNHLQKHCNLLHTERGKMSKQDLEELQEELKEEEGFCIGCRYENTVVTDFCIDCSIYVHKRELEILIHEAMQEGKTK